MVQTISILVNGLVISALYALIAIGFTLIFGVGGILNFAHGSFITLGGFSAYWISNLLGFNTWFGIIAGFVISGAIGGLLYLGIFRFIRDQTVITMIVTLLAGFSIEHVLRIYVTSETIAISPPIPGGVSIAGQGIQYTGIAIFAIAWIYIYAVFWFVNSTEIGKSIIASSMSIKGSRLVGIETDRVNLYTWTLAAALGGIAGVLLTVLETGQWNMGTEPLILSFAIVILGGLGSIKGSVIGAHIIGFTETLTATVGDPRYTGLSSFILLVLFLLMKPEGLFGRQEAS